MEVKKDDLWYLIDSILFFSQDWEYDNLINLRKKIWDDIIYWKDDNIILSFPWEYDINNIYIKAIVDNDWNMNYYIKDDEKSFCIIQSSNALDNDFFQSCDYIYCEWILLDDLKVKLEKNEIDVSLNSLDNVDNY